jgi:hypothetical protein
MSAPIKVVADTKYPTMYRLKWKDGVLSEDMYNLTRAKDILRNYPDYVADMKKAEAMQGNTYARCPRKPADALKQEPATQVAPNKITHVRGSNA